MVRLLISAVIHLIANGMGLLIATAVLDDMSVSVGAFVIAVLIFSVVEAVVGPLIREVAVRNAHALIGSTALVTTFVGLLITALTSDGLEIDGAVTWVLATIIVWLAALLAALLLPLVLFRKVLEHHAEHEAD